MSEAAGLPVRVHDPRIRQQPHAEAPELDASCWGVLPDGSVLLHSDVGGLNPLCWRIIAGTLHIGRFPSDLALIPPRAALDHSTLNLLVALAFPSDTASCFHGVHRVLAGHQVRVDPGGVASVPRRWWTLSPEDTNPAHPDLWGALVRQCEELMRPAPAAAVLLSGGVDSSTVAAATCAAARRQGWPVPLLLSVRYGDLACDESPWQDAVARHLDAELIVVDATMLPVWPTARRICVERGTPMADIQSAAVAALLATAHQRGHHLILSGLGADVLFQGDGVEIDLLLRGRIGAVHRFFSGIAAAKSQSLARMWFRRGLRGLIGRRKLAPPQEVKEAGGYSRAWLRKAICHPITGWRGEMLERTIGESVTFGSPFLGAAFLREFALVRSDDLAAGGSLKGLLRSMARPQLPPSVLDRSHKANFFDFHRAWIPRERSELIRRYAALRAEAPRELELPMEIGSLLADENLTTGLITAWTSLSVLEFQSAWDQGLQERNPK